MKELKKLLKPYNIHHEKIRIGGKRPQTGEWDGNYVLSKDVLMKCKCMYSYGVGEDVSAEVEYHKLTSKSCYLYDHTIDGHNINKMGLPFIYKKEGLGYDSDRCDDFLNHYRYNETEGDVILKIDVEGSEYDYFNNVDIDELANRVGILLIELHELNKDMIRGKAVEILEKINKHFVLHHIHANNYGVIKDDIPSVPELSFVNRRYINTIDEERKKYPIVGLDYPNTIQYKDISLDFTGGELKSKRINHKKIPNIFHFVFGLAEQTEEFNLIHYLSLKSCIEVNNPDMINFYYKYEPFGKYWDMIKPKLNLIEVEPPTEIYGIPIKHYAHQADIIRLQVLIEDGGVYADIDTLFINPYPDELFSHDFVMGKQGNEGLCNALMMSAPYSYFTQKWLHDHQFCFKGGAPGSTGWCTHSVYYPLKLSKENPNDIHIESPSSFFKLLYHQEDLYKLFKEDIELSDSVYSMHLWETVSWDNYLSELTPEKIKNEDTTFNKIVRKLL